MTKMKGRIGASRSGNTQQKTNDLYLILSFTPSIIQTIKQYTMRCFA